MLGAFALWSLPVSNLTPPNPFPVSPSIPSLRKPRRASVLSLNPFWNKAFWFQHAAHAIRLFYLCKRSRQVIQVHARQKNQFHCHPIISHCSKSSHHFILNPCLHSLFYCSWSFFCFLFYPYPSFISNSYLPFNTMAYSSPGGIGLKAIVNPLLFFPRFYPKIWLTQTFLWIPQWFSMWILSSSSPEASLSDSLMLLQKLAAKGHKTSKSKLKLSLSEVV